MRTVAVAVRRLTGAAVILLAVAALLLTVAMRTDAVRVSRVLTGSMAPYIDSGALVAARPHQADDIEPGQVVMFLPPAPFGTPGGAPIAHRVTQVTRENGDVLIHTKGDANATEDPWTLNASESTVFRVSWDSARAGRLADLTGRVSRSLFVTLLVSLAALRVLVALWRPRGPGRHREDASGVRWLRESAAS